MVDVLHIDWETRSDVDLTKVGLDVYSSPASHPAVLMGSYAINSSAVQHWEAHRREIPAELKEAIEDPEVEKWAFGAQFERVISERVLGLKVTRKNWRCSMVLAYMQSFTGGLAEVGEQIGLPQDKLKHKSGRRLIRMFTMPQRITKNQLHLWRDWNTDPVEWQEFCEYNIQDTATETAVKTRLISYPVLPEEWAFYELDQLINDRGMPADPVFIENLIWMSARRKAELLGQMEKLTGLDNPNSTQQLLPWLQERGYPYNDVQKESVTKALNMPPSGREKSKYWERRMEPRDLRRALELRQWASRTSVAKVTTAKLVMGSGDRIRYLFQFAGASRTNRFSGRKVQSQNLIKTPKVLDAEESDEKLSFVTDLVRNGEYDAFDLLFKEPMEGLAGCLRSMFRAPEGCEFIAADLKSIESAVLAWLSGCKRLLEVFREGRDPYKDFGVEFYRKVYDEITREERNVCKPPALGCGFRLGPGKEADGVKTGLLKYAENMGVSLTLEQAIRAVKVFRETYPEIKQFWYDCEKAVRFVLNTHKPFKLGHLTFEWLKPYLLIRLPSGRRMFFYKPRLEQREIDTGRLRRDGTPDTYTRTVFTHMGKSQKTQQWIRLESHGGVLTEEVTQATARDVLKVGLTRLHEAGFCLVGHAHDEALALARVGGDQLGRMIEIMCRPIDWAPGLSLGASGWRGKFYRK